MFQNSFQGVKNQFQEIITDSENHEQVKNVKTTTNASNRPLPPASKLGNQEDSGLATLLWQYYGFHSHGHRLKIVVLVHFNRYYL